MRELHAWHGHGDRHRHARDAAADAPGRHARAAPGHEARDALKLKMLLDPEAPKAEHLSYRKTVEAYEPKHAADDLKPRQTEPGIRALLPQLAGRPVTTVGLRAEFRALLEACRGR